MKNINNISTGEILSTIASLKAEYFLTSDDKPLRRASARRKRLDKLQLPPSI